MLLCAVTDLVLEPVGLMKRDLHLDENALLGVYRLPSSTSLLQVYFVVTRRRWGPLTLASGAHIWAAHWLLDL